MIEEEILYECMNCGYETDLEDVQDAEDDGDICGTCPNCKKYVIWLKGE